MSDVCSSLDMKYSRAGIDCLAILLALLILGAEVHKPLVESIKNSAGQGGTLLGNSCLLLINEYSKGDLESFSLRIFGLDEAVIQVRQYD